MSEPHVPRPGDAQRPCQISDARAREFEYLVDRLRQSIVNCGLDHGRGVANGYASDFGHDADVLFRVAAAEAASCR